MNLGKFYLVTYILLISVNANAVLINTINGVDYEWLELTETAGQSRAEVEVQLLDSGSALYGYEYASRQLFFDLLYSYSRWDGIDGMHGAPDVVNNLFSLISDFGVIDSYVSEGLSIGGTVDGYAINYTSIETSYGYYGTSSECPYLGDSCAALLRSYTLYGTPVAGSQSQYDGWSLDTYSSGSQDSGYQYRGSFLVRTISPVPVPAAIWLFASGLIGIVTLARRKSRV